MTSTFLKESGTVAYSSSGMFRRGSANSVQQPGCQLSNWSSKVKLWKANKQVNIRCKKYHCYVGAFSKTYKCVFSSSAENCKDLLNCYTCRFLHIYFAQGGCYPGFCLRSIVSSTNLLACFQAHTQTTRVPEKAPLLISVPWFSVLCLAQILCRWFTVVPGLSRPTL